MRFIKIPKKIERSWPGSSLFWEKLIRLKKRKAME